jgi:hypothetical protein
MKGGLLVSSSLAAIVLICGRVAEGAIEILSQSRSTAVTASANDVFSTGIDFAYASSALSGGTPGIVDAGGTVGFGSDPYWRQYYPQCELLSSYFRSWSVVSIYRDPSSAGFDIGTVTVTANYSVNFEVTEPVTVHLLSSYDLMGATSENGFDSVELGYGGELVGPGMLANVTDLISDRAMTLPVGMYILNSWLNVRTEQVAIPGYPVNVLMHGCDANFGVSISLPEGTEVTVVPEPATIIIFWSLLGSLGVAAPLVRKAVRP